MFVARSCDDIPTNVGQETANRTMTLDEAAGGDASRLTNRPWTRQQARREAVEQESANDARVRQIVHETMSGFRDEIADLIANRMRNVNLSGEVPDGQGRLQNMTRRMDRNPVDEDNRSVTSRQGRDDRGTRDFGSNSERILNIIRNWRIRFTGDSSEISIEEFIYRVNTLTRSNLRGDFDLLCEHAHLLFEGKALKWYWRYHRTTEFMDWDDLCDALKRQYKDFTTDFDIKDDILRRKQRPNETFDEFYDAIITLCDRLRTPFTENDLCETIQRNLRPEVRHEILHLEITRLPQLRRAVRRYEKFMKDFSSSSNKRSIQKQLSEIVETDTQITDEMDENDSGICCGIKSGKCWNCDNVGHSFMDCLEPRTVFCYGCGAKNIYKPNCLNCLSKRGNVKRDVRATKDGHPEKI